MLTCPKARERRFHHGYVCPRCQSAQVQGWGRERIHVHVAHPDGEAKFWLDPRLALATQTGLSSAQLHAAQEVVERHIEEVRHA